MGTVHRLNVLGTRTVIEAAKDTGVPKVIFASTDLVAAGYADFYDGELTPGHELTVDKTMRPRPNSDYAVSKLFGEHLGRYYVDYRDAPNQFYGIRIGWVLAEDYDHPYGPAERGVDNGHHERGDGDYRDLVEAAGSYDVHAGTSLSSSSSLSPTIPSRTISSAFGTRESPNDWTSTTLGTFWGTNPWTTPTRKSHPCDSSNVSG